MGPSIDVVVIGCGASGIAALSKLHEAGLNVLGLEAADRTGGRIHSLEFAGGLVDIGAAWCIGETGNIVYELASPYNLLGRPEAVIENYFMLSNGTSMPPGEAQRILGKFTEAIDKSHKNSSMSISEVIRNEMKTISPADFEKVEPFIQWYERDNNLAGQDDPRQGKSLKSIQENKVCPGEVWLHWKGKGYQTIMDVLLKKYTSTPITPTILLKKEVCCINWEHEDADGKPFAEVICVDGTKFEAKAVICTLTVGVLKERHSQLFNPALPSEKVNCINNIGYCVLDKIHIEFATQWWPKSPTSFKIIWKEEDKTKFSAEEKWITEIYELRTIEHSYLPNVLVAFIYGKGAEQVEYKTLEDVKAGIEKLCDQIFSMNFNVSDIKSIERTKWRKNRFARGTYSYRSVATEETGASAATLGTPLVRKGAPVVCFAGEATSTHHHGSVHGAVEAGFREADRLIRTYKDFSNP